MEEKDASNFIARDFPQVEVKQIQKIGEGLGNVAFEINQDIIFRFPKKPRNLEELRREIPITELVSKYSHIPVPKFEFIAPANSYVGYRKLKGEPLIYARSKFTNWSKFSEQVGLFLRSINDIPLSLFESLEINHEPRLIDDDWLESAKKSFNAIQSLIPSQHLSYIEKFFSNPIPSSIWEPVFSHNDLGIEHILVDDNSVSGIIDWGDTAITDPASDFGRIYRDLGEEILNTTLDHYSLKEGLVRKGMIERAMFYGKCSVFESIEFGVNYKKQAYIEMGLDSLRWMFNG